MTKEETGADTETEKQFLHNTYTRLLKNVDAKPGKSKTETYEDNAKSLFISQPANMRLLIVVDKLLTGFDAPSCTYATHNARFIALMDQYMPKWQSHRKALNRLPVRQESWGY